MNKKLITVVIIMIMMGGIVLAEALNIDAEMKGSYSMYYEEQTEGVIEVFALPDQETAIKVASTIVGNFTAADKMASVYAKFDTDNFAWIITFAPESAPDTIMLGDETTIVLSASDCRVLKIWGAE